MQRRLLFSLIVMQFLSVRAGHTQSGQPADTVPSVPGTVPVASASQAEDDAQPTPQPLITPGRFDALTSSCLQEADNTPAAAYCKYFVGYLTAPSNDERIQRLKYLVHLAANPAAFSDAYSNAKTSAALGIADQNVFEKAASNPQQKQVSSPAVTNGSTSLVSKPVATNLIALAVESGALTQTQSGSTITIQANLDHLLRAVYTLNQSQISYLPKGTPYLENFTVSASLAANTNSTVTVPTTGSATTSPINTSSVTANSSATKLSSLSLSYEFNNKLTQGYLTKFMRKNKLTHISIAADTTTGPALQAARAALGTDIDAAGIPAGCDESGYEAIGKTLSSEAASGGPNSESFNGFVTTFNHCFDDEVAGVKGDLDTDWNAYVQALQADVTSFQNSLKQELTGWDLSAQYVYNKPVGQPNTHDFRLIGSGPISKAAGSSWAVNGAATLYGSVPSGAQYGRLKDAQLSGELDKALGTHTSAPTFSIAGYGQYQNDPSVLNVTASSVPSGITLPSDAQVFLSGTQGWLGVAQVKLTLNVAGAQVPLAFKWSNKTNLLDKTKFGGQFGISYDFNSLKQIVGLAGTPTN